MNSDELRTLLREVTDVAIANMRSVHDRRAVGGGVEVALQGRPGAVDALAARVRERLDAARLGQALGQRGGVEEAAHRAQR